MTCRSPRKEDSTFLPATAVVSVLRKSGNTKIFAAVVLAAVAIAITITTSGLWDDSALATIFDNHVAPATVIPNVSDVWYALDAVDSIISSEWLIPPAFAEITATFPADREVRGGENVTISYVVTSNTTLTYFWEQVPAIPDLDLRSNTQVPTVTFTVPEVDHTTSIEIGMIAATIDNTESIEGSMTLTILVGSIPIVDAGPNIHVTHGQSYTLSGATATDTEDDAADLTIAWTAVPSGAVTTIHNRTTLTPTIDVSSNTNYVNNITLTMSVTDSDRNTMTDTRVLIREGTVVDDTTAPVITIKGDNPATVTVNTVYRDEGATCTDAVDGLRTVTTTGVSFSTATTGTHTVTYTCSDTSDNEATATRTVNVQAAVNIAPTVVIGGPLSVALGLSIIPNPDIVDPDGTSNHLYTWTQSPAGTVTFSATDSLRPTISAALNATPGPVTLTLTVNDNNGEYIVEDMTTLTIFDPNTNVAPTIDNISGDITVKERTSVTLTAIASDHNTGDILTYLWDDSALPADIVVTGENDKSMRFTAPGIQSGTRSFEFTLTVTDQGGLTATSDVVTVTVEDVPLEVSSVTYNPGNGQLKIIFNQDIESNPSYGSIHVRSTGSSSGDISLSDVAEKSHSGRTITATLSTAQQEVYADMQNPQLDINRGAVTAPDGTSIGEISDKAIRTISNKKSSSSIAPIVDLRTLEQARIVDIPQSILEQVSSHDDSDPLKPISHNRMFDLPLAINGYYYLLDDTTNTLIPQTVTAGQSTEIVFTVYTKTDLAHFTLYLNMQGNDVNYAYSDTSITYKNDDPISVTDKHGYIADATITVTQEDDSMPEKKTVRITIHFDEPMGSTNMVAYMWNTDRKAALIKMIGALEVVAAAETSETDSSSSRSSNPAGSGSEPDTPKDDQGSISTPSIIKSGIVIVGNDDDDDAQTLSLIRMWSGFESESLTDAELLESLNLDYPGVDIPNWMMTDLGALVSTGDVTVEEFRTALVYMLEILTA